MNIAPTRDIVLIKADKARDKTASGLLIKEDWKSLPLAGVILAIGPGVTNVEIGDRVLFERYSSVILEDDERLCKASHIIAMLDKLDD